MSPGGTLLLLFYGQQGATPPTETTRYANPSTTRVVARDTGATGPSVDPRYTRITTR